MPSANISTHFKTLQRFAIEYSPSFLTQYESQRTGMRVVVVDQKGPKVLGFFALATEIHDDSGAPHTLEHLCFMGSKSYRYKGILDKLATRAYSNTNAWTATDHTAYTLDTAGWEGFAQVLPVYLEHVIVPTLTDAGCYTEVHHIDGTGNDAGVVYSEMQGVQNTQSEIMELKTKRLLYPEDIGFRYETGGMMEQLRVLSADRIRAFHREMYQPKNLCLVIVGEIHHEDMLRILDNFEDTILDDIPKPNAPFRRPWVESKQTPSLTESTIETIEFPEEDESSGEISISFLGPSCNDVVQTTALDILQIYLAGSSASVLENIIVETEQLASAVYYSAEYRPDTVIQFTLSSVDTEKLASVEERFFEVLRDTASKKLDMQYMMDCIQRMRRQIKFEAEHSGMFFTGAVIQDFLFGNRDGTTLNQLKSLSSYDEVETWTDQHWRKFLSQWISEAPHITVLGKPSAELSRKLKIDEEARVAAQIKRLGMAGLKELEGKLDAAKAENDREIPKDILDCFAVPSISSIHFIESTTARSGAAGKMGRLENRIQSIIDKNDKDLPLFIHFEHIPSNFVHINLLINTESIPISLRPLLSIYLENFFSTPIQRNGQRVEFEQVVMELEKDTIGYSIGSATDLGNAEVLRVLFQVEASKYETAIGWLKTMLWQSIFDLTRLKTTTARLLSEIPEEKRSGSAMVYAAELMLHTSPSSIGRACGTLVKAVYLKRIKSLLDSSPDLVISQLNEIRTALCQFSNFRTLIIANVESLHNPVTAWKTFMDSLDANKPLSRLDTRLSRLSVAGQTPGDLAYVIPLSTIDSSFAISVAKGPESLDDSRIPALMVAISYLNAVEGPLWTAVRGTGLAYGTSFSRHVDSGHVLLSIYRSPDVLKAFAASKRVVENLASGATPFNDLALEGAISGIVLGLANSEATMASAAQMSFTRQVVRELPATWTEKILKEVRAVRIEEIKEVMKDTLLPAFNASTANVFVTCAPIMEHRLVEGFEGMGFKPEVRPLAWFQDDYGLQGEDGEQETEDDMDEGSEAEQGSDNNYSR